MNVVEARRSRHLLVHLDSGESLPDSLVAALDAQEAKSAVVHGAGTLESAQIALWDAVARRFHPVRAVEGPCELLSLVGSVARHQGRSTLVARAVLGRETALGVETFGGQLVSARAANVDLHVVAFDDVTLTLGERDGAAVLTTGSVGVLSTEAAAPAAASAAGSSASATSTDETPRPPAAGASGDGPAATLLPLRPPRVHEEDLTIYPEPEDLVNHFHFGECTIVSSDGERIRLRQEKDGRVREVALTMLRIEPPTVDPATGRRHFNLMRKN